MLLPNALMRKIMSYQDARKCLLNDEPLQGETLAWMLDIVDVKGDDDFSKLVRNIGNKMKEGKSLDDYESHIVLDVLLLSEKMRVNVEQW
jgi:hypothetical protein